MLFTAIVRFDPNAFFFGSDQNAFSFFLVFWTEPSCVESSHGGHALFSSLCSVARLTRPADRLHSAIQATNARSEENGTSPALTCPTSPKLFEAGTSQFNAVISKSTEVTATSSSRKKLYLSDLSDII